MATSTSYILELTQAAFRQEAEELLAELDSALLQLEATPNDANAVNRAFRAMHTLKGSGATAGFVEVSMLVHDVESIFNDARGGRVRISSGAIDLALKIGDVVRRLLLASRGEGPGLLGEGMKIVGELKALVALPAPAAAVGAPARSAPAGGDVENASGLWSIHFAPDPRILQRGNDPLRILRELLALGSGLVRADTERLCAERAFDPEHCYLSWGVQLVTPVTRQKIQDVFAFVEAESDVRIEPVAPGQAWVLPPEAYFDAATFKEFREEANEDIAEIEAHVLALEEAVGAPGALAGLKRVLHNLKGVSQLLLSDVKLPPPARHPLRAMSELCHAAETFLDSFEAEPVTPGEASSEALLETVDWLKVLLGGCDEARDEWPTELLLRLGAANALAAPGAPFGAAGGETADLMTRSIVEQCDQVVRAVEARRGEDLSPSSTDWSALARALGTLGKAALVERTADVASHVQGLASLCGALAREGPAAPSAWGDFRERYLGVGKLLEAHVDAGLPLADVASPSGRYKARTISLRPSKPSVAAPPTQRPTAGATAPRSVRVELAKLDVLMGAIGELLVAKNALPLLVSRVRAAESQAGKEIDATVEQIAHIADDLQNAMRQIRMMPIRGVFQRFPRMIRDLARSENKQVQLIISGEETELDKTVLEQIGDPLVHLVRNSVDHGIESPEERRAQGKPEMGTVALEVLKEGSNVVIRISDDGRGMDPRRLRAKAREKGLLSEAEAAELSDKRALELIFLPGFSTAEAVTDISGRGVGMDVVQSNIRQMHGTIAIASDLGQGSVISIELPSSLMVSKGMLVECASEQYVLPIEGVREMVKIRRDQVRQFRDVAMTNIRGAICPVFSLARLLGLEQGDVGDALMREREEENAVVVATQGGTIAILVDRLVNEIDVIVKPLSKGLDKLSLFQGATILGDGSVALIIDLSKLDALAALDSRQGRAAT